MTRKEEYVETYAHFFRHMPLVFYVEYEDLDRLIPLVFCS